MKRHIWLILTLLAALYITGASILAHHYYANRLCTGVRIEVTDTARNKFVTPYEINRDLDDIISTADGRPLDKINTAKIERHLAAIDKIESATVVKTSDGKIVISVVPMRPVVRIFDNSGRSYYINKDGKRMSASSRYHSDVPIIQGSFTDTIFTPEHLLPLVNFIESDSTWRSLVSYIKADSPSDIIVVPVISGHVINLGDMQSLEDKFGRLRTFYRRVLPVKGWNFYDTISVKWGRQVVATRAVKHNTSENLFVEDIDESDDITTMIATDNTAPGQTKAGVKAKSEKPIPAAMTENSKKQTPADSSANINENKKKKTKTP